MISLLSKNLAANTQRLMDEHGWSQRELAKKAGISQSGVGFVLRYRDSSDRHAAIDTVEALAKAFGVSALEMLSDGSGERPKSAKFDKAKATSALAIVHRSAARSKRVPAPDIMMMCAIMAYSRLLGGSTKEEVITETEGTFLAKA